jgi:PBP1b-binding outer membrane lipoprotein LpoB
MKKLVLVLSVLGMAVLSSGCVSQVGDDEEDATQQDEAAATVQQDDATATATPEIHSRRVCRHVCHRDRFGRRHCRRVCRIVRR